MQVLKLELTKIVLLAMLASLLPTFWLPSLRQVFQPRVPFPSELLQLLRLIQVLDCWPSHFLLVFLHRVPSQSKLSELLDLTLLLWRLIG